MISLNRGLVYIHGSSSLMMVGIIWYVQVVQYPLFEMVAVENWTEYEIEYTQRAGVIIAPLMIIELLSGVIIAIQLGSRSFLAWLNFGLILLIWISTFAVQVPLHLELSNSWDASTWEILLNSNWFRTILWSVKSGILFLMFENLRTP